MLLVQEMCDVDVLDLSLRCGQSQSLMSIDHVDHIDWTSPPSAASSVVCHVTSSPPWSGCHGPPAARYDLEPVSPSSSPDGSQPPPSVELDAAFYPRLATDHASPARWSSPDTPVATTSAAVQTASGAAAAAARRWNGDAGVPYSPLKRVLHHYRSSIASAGGVDVEENVSAATAQTSLINGCTRYTCGELNVAELNTAQRQVQYVDVTHLLHQQHHVTVLLINASA